MMNYRTWVEVDLQAIKDNVVAIKQLLPKDCLFMAVVKANGYGHGSVPVAKAALEAGAERLGVAIVEEARALREAGIDAPIHLMTGFVPGQLQEIEEFNLIPAIFTPEHLQELKSLTKPLKVNVKVDTGMGRIGLQPNEVRGFVKEAAENKNIEIEGIFTHFATADEKESPYAQKQLETFNHLRNQLSKEGFDFKLNHAANSAAAILNPESHLQMARIGISLYGLHPSEATKGKIKLMPALSWYARLSHLKSAQKGTSVSYGATHTLEKETVIGTVPVGYADGYSRNLSNKSKVLVRNEIANQIGRVCMDQFMIDLDEIGAKTGDIVTLIGQNGNKEITVDFLAKIIGTINYEIVCGISARVPRLYKNE